TDLETTLNDFVATHRTDIIDLLDDGLDNGSYVGGPAADDVYVTDGRLFIYDDGNTLGNNLLAVPGNITADVDGTGSANVVLDQGHDNGDPTVDDNAPTPTQDNTQDLVVSANNPGTPAIPAG